MNKRHRLFAEALLRNKGNQTKAYLDVYDNCSPKSAPSKASRLVRNGKVHRRIAELFEANSLELEALLQSLAEDVVAVKPYAIGSEVAFHPDFEIRLKAKKLVLELYGLV